MAYRCFRNFIEAREPAGGVQRVALTSALASALLFTSCGTPGTRISQHPSIYQGLSSRDQALVSQGQIRLGMSMDAVWLAWGTPEQKVPGYGRRRPTENNFVRILQPKD
jgi:outer membrane protein assembly factor BamE (lipoprotein component of BamABCDE complex)